VRTEENAADKQVGGFTMELRSDSSSSSRKTAIG
jgi:hypothetical protein